MFLEKVVEMCYFKFSAFCISYSPMVKQSFYSLSAETSGKEIFSAHHVLRSKLIKRQRIESELGKIEL